MPFEIRSADFDAQEILRQVRRQIAEKKPGLVTDAEIREIVEHTLDAVLDAHELKVDFLSDFRAQPQRWNFLFDAETVYRSSRGLVGRGLQAVRRILRPVQKLFWNPNPMISALSRQSDLNNYYVHLFHNLAVELTRLNLEVQDLKNRNLQLQGRVELLARREKTLESMAVLREEGKGEEKT